MTCLNCSSEIIFANAFSCNRRLCPQRRALPNLDSEKSNMVKQFKPLYLIGAFLLTVSVAACGGGGGGTDPGRGGSGVVVPSAIPALPVTSPLASATPTVAATAAPTGT